MTQPEEVLKFLSKEPYRSCNAKEIGMGTGIPHKIAGVVANRMVSEGKILKPKRGYFQHPEGLIKPEVYPFFGLHGLKFESRCYKIKGWSFRRLKQFLTLRFPLVGQPHKKNGSIPAYTDWQGRGVVTTIHSEKTTSGDKKELIEVFCHSSQLPLTPLEYMEYTAWVEGLFGIPAELWELVQKGINVDFGDATASFTDSGCISMADSRKAVARLYQKGKDFRIEIHDREKISVDHTIEVMKKVLLVQEALNRGSE